MAESIPEELVRALLNDDSIDALHVGAVAPDFPTELIPPKVQRIVGGTSGPHGLSGIFALGSADDPLSVVARHLEAAGYESNPSIHVEGFQHNLIRLMQKGRMQATI